MVSKLVSERISQELVVESPKDTAMEEARARAIHWLEETRGSIPKVKRLTKAEREKLALEFTPEKSREIAKRYGFS